MRSAHRASKGSLGHPVTPSFASKACGIAPRALQAPSAQKQEAVSQEREDGLSFRFPAKGLSV
ncbi:MAG: hypothetical protein ACOYMG_05270 [Candidatus Methylumidiphilus sp.]